MVGMQRVVPMMNGALLGSQRVYPRASKVERMPPLGKLEASGSCWTSRLPSKRSMAPPRPSGWMKLSCFSAVLPVKGWNQWV